MNTQPSHRTNLVSEQTLNNSTSWIGHSLGDSNDISKGQTFEAMAEGDIENVQVFSNIVTSRGDVKITIHSFDPQQKSWSNALSSSTVPMQSSDTGRWITFPLTGMHLQKGKIYGFRVESHQSLIGLGEAASSAGNPSSANGQEWRFTNTNGSGDAFSYFSLAYKVGIRA